MGFKTTIVYGTFNHLEYTYFSLNSLINTIKSEKEIQLLLIDNGSDDGTVKFLRKIQKQNKKHFQKNKSEIMLILNDKNYGSGRIKNLGIDLARGKYILFLDNDLYFHHKNWLKKVSSLCNQIKEEFILTLNLEYDSEYTYAQTGVYDSDFLKSYKFKKTQGKLLQRKIYPLSVSIAPKSVWKKAGYFVENISPKRNKVKIKSGSIDGHYEKKVLKNNIKRFVMNYDINRNLGQGTYEKKEKNYIKARIKRIKSHINFIKKTKYTTLDKRPTKKMVKLSKQYAKKNKLERDFEVFHQ